MARWKVNRKMAIVGVVFGVAATLSGMFLLDAVQGGFLAEGFFLIVLSWIFIPILILRIVRRLRKKCSDDSWP